MIKTIKEALRLLDSKPQSKILELDFDNCSSFSEAEIKKLASACKENKDLTSIQIKFNGTLNQANFKLFATELRAGSKASLDINFGYHKLAESINTEGMEELALVIQSGQLPGLKLAGLGKLGNNGFKALTGALQSGKAIENLEVHYFAHTADNVQDLCKALTSGKASKNLTFDFSFGYFLREEIKDFAKAIKSGLLPENLTLDFSFTDIDDEGTIALAEALASGKAPKWLTLNLTGNKFTSKGLIHLANMLNSGKAPEGLKLKILSSTLEVTDECALAFMNALQPQQGTARKLPMGLRLNLDYKIITAMIKKGFTEKNLHSDVVIPSVIEQKQWLAKLEKIESLKKVCKSYISHLEKHKTTRKNGQSKLVDANRTTYKINIVNQLIHTLEISYDSTDTQLDNFSKKLKQFRPELEKSRDTKDMIFLKRIVNILTLGAASLLGIWKVKGDAVCKELEAHFESKNTPKIQ